MKVRTGHLPFAAPRRRSDRWPRPVVFAVMAGLSIAGWAGIVWIVSRFSAFWAWVLVAGFPAACVMAGGA